MKGDENIWQGHDKSVIETYARFRPPFELLAMPWITDFYRSCHPHTAAGDKISLAVDVGCGPGQFSVLLSDVCQRVLAVDSAEDMLELARRDYARPNVDYRLGSALDLSDVCADHEADLVVVAEAAHLFNIPRFYAEVERVLKPDGVLAMVGYFPSGFRHNNDQSLETVYREFLQRERLSNAKVKAMMPLLYNFYKDLNPPFPVDLYRHERLEVATSRETLYGMAVGSTDPFRGGLATLDRFLDSLPDAWPLTMIHDVFGVFIQMKK